MGCLTEQFFLVQTVQSEQTVRDCGIAPEHTFPAKQVQGLGVRPYTLPTQDYVHSVECPFTP